VNPQTNGENPAETTAVNPTENTTEAAIGDSKETTGPASCAMGPFHFALPEGMSMRTVGSEQRFYAEDAEVGGLA
ncbi:hypothetical protein RFZ45_14250, partial [Acinetobacter baumannii]|nr:hypothetical protein [Acinetobacter baumannii]